MLASTSSSFAASPDGTRCRRAAMPSDASAAISGWVCRSATALSVTMRTPPPCPPPGGEGYSEGPPPLEGEGYAEGPPPPEGEGDFCDVISRCSDAATRLVTFEPTGASGGEPG